MSAVGFPRWVLLEPFVFRRDDDESFPGDTEAPIRATGTTSWGADFRIAFSLAEPPHISRLYAQLPVPGFPDRSVRNPLTIVATHRHLALVRVATRTDTMLTVQNFFIFTANENPSSSLKALPPCTEPDFDYSHDCDRLRLLYHGLPDATPRLLDVRSLGFWCKGEEFVAAELSIYKPINRPKAFADICLLRSSCKSHGDQLGGTWDSMRVQILSTDDPSDADLWQFCCWYTQAVIPFRKWLCWIDYHRGILFCDMSKLPAPTISFVWFPLDKMPMTSNRTAGCSFFHRGVSVVDHGRTLKFVNITRHDGVQFGALKPGASFTITCHTLVLGGGSMAWKEDYTVTSSELWDANPPEHLPRGILVLPRVDIDRPHVAHFLCMEFGYAKKKMWVVAIDMSTKTVESFSLYINGNEGLKPEDKDLVRKRSTSPRPFLPCEFPTYLNLSRYPGWSQSIVRFFAGFTTQVSIRHNLSRKIAEINLRLEYIIENKEKYKVEAAPNDILMLTWKPSTNISMAAKNFDDAQPSPIKREDKVKQLEEALFSDKENRLVICVTGEGGVGKATLVRELYDKPTTKLKFEFQAWVSFAPYLRTSSILQIIYQKLEETDTWVSRDDVYKKLKEKLSSQKPFLLVLDGEVSNSDWNAILAALPDDDDDHRSRIVRIMQGTHKRPHGIVAEHWIELQCFEKAKTISLFDQRACTDEKTNGQINTEKFDDDLYGITKGLPLAIVLLSGLMQTKEYPNEWKAVFDHLQSQKSKRLDSILAMCFDDLPHDLKSCFLYFAALPMNTPIEARKLVCMWMAEGFLRPKDGKTMEKVGRIYLHELIIRHLVIFVKTDNVSASDEFVAVHHKVHSFLQHEAQEASFVDIHNGDDIPSLATTRRLSLQNYTDKYAALANSLPKLRSILSNFQEEIEEDDDNEYYEECEDEEEGEEEEFSEEEESEEGGDIEGEQNVEGDGDEEDETKREENKIKENVPYVENENDEENQQNEVNNGVEDERSDQEANQEVLPCATPFSGLLNCWEPLSGLLPCHKEQGSPQKSIKSYIKEMFRVSKFLRVINLQGIEIGENLPATIGNLAHLQYLGVTACSLKYIPSTIENLKNLQTLDVRDTYVDNLPEAFWNITTLRHVFGNGLSLPKEVGDLKHLQTLESIDPDENNGWDSKTFEKMVHLQSLHVYDSSENGVNPEAISTVIDKANFLEYLDTLTLDVNNIPLSVFTSSSLRRLRTLNLQGKLMDMSMLQSEQKESKFLFPNLKLLSLTNTEVSQDFINKLGKLPLLANLVLDTNSYKDDHDLLVFHAGGFKSLTKLTLSDLENVMKLRIEKSALPELTDLEVEWYPDDIEIEVHGEPEFVKKIQEVDEYLYGRITHVPVAPRKFDQLPSMKHRVAGRNPEVN